MNPLIIAVFFAMNSTPASATLETSRGERVTLGSLISKPTIVFFEDRDSTAVNQHVKDALYERGKRQHLLQTVSVIAIANVKDWGWFPARNFVLKSVRDTEAKVHIPIYLDFTGSMTEAPWSLPAKSSTVMVLDANAAPIKQFNGKLSESDVESLFAAVQKFTE